MTARSAVVLGARGDAKLLLDLEKALFVLRKMWHARLFSLFALKEAGWKKIDTRRKLMYAANCPPFSVETRVSQHRCDLSWICPFCYARRNVVETFRAAERFLFGPEGKKAPLDRELRVVWFRTAKFEIRDPGLPKVPAALARNAAYFLRMPLMRDLEKKHFSAVAGVANYHLAPLEDGGVRVQRTGVLIVRKSEALAGLCESYRAFGYDCGDPLPPLRRSLSLAFARGMSYDRAAMISPPAAAAVLLNAMGGFRYRTVYGGMRGSE